MTRRMNLPSLKSGGSTLLRSFGYGFYMMIRPIHGFHEMKNEGKGSFGAALLIGFLAIVAVLFNVHNAGFIFTTLNPHEYNIIRHLSGLLLPFMLWCLCNWAVSVLLDGEGKLYYIFMASCYALLPFIVLQTLSVLLSHALLYDERMFLNYLSNLGLGWSILMLFTGNMSIHQYTVKRTLLSFVMSIAGILLVMYISILFASIIDRVVRFGMGLFIEIRLRM